MKCKNCGLDYEGNFCPRCGAPANFTPPPPQQQPGCQTPQVQCPRCGSRNITYHREEAGNVGLHQNTVVIQEQSKNRAGRHRTPTSDCLERLGGSQQPI